MCSTNANKRIEDMKHDEIKSRLQKEVLDTINEHNGKGIIAIATGGGKTKIAIDYCKQIVKENPNAKILVVVPTRVLRDNEWESEFVKWKATTILRKNVRKECYISINKIENEEFDLVILDEVQNITVNNSKFFQSNKVDKIIGLTATPPKEKEKKEILQSLNLNVIHYTGLDEAVEIGLVAPYELTLISTNLNRTKAYVLAGGKNRKWYTTENRQYEYLDYDIQKAKYRGVSNAIMKMKYLNRMRFIYNLKSKEAVAKYVLDNIIPKDERTLIFAGSIKTAEALCSYTYHSKTDSTDLDKFRNGEINRLSAVNALNEGVNISNVDNAFIVQINSKERHLIQKIGRILRTNGDHRGKIYLLYVEGTVDEKWMHEATKELDKTDVRYIKIRN